MNTHITRGMRMTFPDSSIRRIGGRGGHGAGLKNTCRRAKASLKHRNSFYALAIIPIDLYFLCTRT